LLDLLGDLIDNLTNARSEDIFHPTGSWDEPDDLPYLRAGPVLMRATKALQSDFA